MLDFLALSERDIMDIIDAVDAVLPKGWEC